MTEMVSILIPAYNAEKWIAQTIGSALAQSWAAKEIIVVDDGSRDKTLEIARRFESSGVKVVTQDNRGAAAARNTALARASGDFIQWLDADDLLAPDKIARQMDVTEGDRSDLTLYSSAYGTFYHRFKKAKFKPNALWQDLSPIDWLVVSLSETLWMNPACWLVSRTLTRIAGPWDERLSVDDDGEYFARVVAACEKVRFVPKAKCYYRQSGFQQLSRDRTDKALGSRLLSTDLRIRTLLTLEKSERTRRAGLTLIQNRMSIFFAENTKAVEQLKVLAADLGGNLEPPRIGWRMRGLQHLLGPKKGKRGWNSLRRLRLAAAVKWDDWMYKLGV